MPWHLYFKKSANDKFPMFSSKGETRETIPETCDQFFDDEPYAPQGKNIDWSLEMKKESDTHLTVTMTFNGVKKSFKKEFYDKDLMPQKLDTFSIVYPNKRYFRYLKIWDPSKGTGGSKLDWDKVVKEGTK